MSGFCSDCSNTLCICDGTPREDIVGTKEFNDKYVLVERKLIPNKWVVGFILALAFKGLMAMGWDIYRIWSR